MLGSLKQERIFTLVDEAISQISTLGDSGVPDIISVLEKTRQVLENPVRAERDIPLVLSAARWRVTNVEKYAVRRIVHDDKVDGRAMSILVRVRLICAEIIRILDRALDESRMARVRFQS